MASALQNASQAQVRETLNKMVAEFPPGDYKITCTSEREAVSLRNRMNRVRANERDAMLRLYADAGRQHDPGGAMSELDSLVFRVRDNVVIVTIADRDAAAIMEQIRAENGMPAISDVDAQEPGREGAAAEVELDRQREDREYANAKLL